MSPKEDAMAIVRDISIDEVPEDAREVYRRYTENYGPFLNQVRVFAHRPPALRHIMGLLLETAENPVVSKCYLEIALVVVSRLTECRYCVTHHVPRLVKQGLSKEAVDNILAPDPGLDPVELLVRDWAVLVTNDPKRAPISPVFARLRRHFSEEQIVELTLRITLCGFFNRFNDALEIEMEPEAIEEMLALEDRR
jgi:uncharacterized peroxidase-related enzyme